MFATGNVLEIGDITVYLIDMLINDWDIEWVDGWDDEWWYVGWGLEMWLRCDGKTMGMRLTIWGLRYYYNRMIN